MMTPSRKPTPRGRGSHVNPPGRFERVRGEPDFEQVADDEEYLAESLDPRTEYLPDDSQTIVTENRSPDIPFRFSLNPYRGCSHGCAYCYARPTHEFLGLSAGLDFETRIFVKHRAAELLRRFLARPSWQPESIALSGVTDPYQPAERQFRVTRGCLEAAWEARQPLGLLTKNALLVRDLDLLAPMAELRLVHVSLSLTTLDAELARTMEPRTSPPDARLRAIRRLTDAGVTVGVVVAPVIPGLNDREIPAILESVADAGAVSAGMSLLRLPPTVQPVFLDWLERALPAARQRIEGLIRSTHGGDLDCTAFGKRLSGSGAVADQALWPTRSGNSSAPSPASTTSTVRSPTSTSRSSAHPVRPTGSCGCSRVARRFVESRAQDS
jgi:DNA repair photolyase